MPAQTKRPSILHSWLRAIRPAALIFTLLPVLLGGGFALVDRGFDGWRFLVAMVAALFLQMGANLLNDCYDYLKGADTKETLSVSSPLREGWLTARQVYVGGVICLVTATVLGLWLVKVGGWLVLLLGVLGLAGAYLYSASRVALSWHGLGELAAFLLLGPLMVLGTYYVMVQLVFVHVLVNAIPLGLLAVSVLHVSNLRDRLHDQKIGKRTLATMLGARTGKALYHLLMVLAYVALVVLWLVDLTPVTALVALLAVPLAVRNLYLVSRTDDPVELNLGLGLTVLHQLVFGMLNVFGIYLYYFLQ